MLGLLHRTDWFKFNMWTSQRYNSDPSCSCKKKYLSHLEKRRKKDLPSQVSRAFSHSHSSAEICEICKLPPMWVTIGPCMVPISAPFFKHDLSISSFYQTESKRGFALWKLMGQVTSARSFPAHNLVIKPRCTYISENLWSIFLNGSFAEKVSA